MPDLHDDPLFTAILDAFPGAIVFIGRTSPVSELTGQEIDSIIAVSPIAGAYLEGIGKTDLATLEEDEWMNFLQVVVIGYAEAMAKAHAPYAVLRSSDDPQLPILDSDVPY